MTKGKPVTERYDNLRGIEFLLDVIDESYKGFLKVTEVAVDCEDVIAPSDLLLNRETRTIKDHVAINKCFHIF